MTLFDRGLKSQFFLTGPRPCPYLPNKMERKLFTNLSGAHAATLHVDLAQHGFRRSQSIAYRPSCEGCFACLSTRVRTAEFTPSRSQKRVAKRNKDLERRIDGPWATEEQYEMFARYLETRHADGGMTDMKLADYMAMVEDTPALTRMVEYRVADAHTPDGKLVAACLTDVLSDGLSLVYSFFDPEFDRRSLGQFMILDHIEIALQNDLPYVYLGYWVPGSAKMGYKSNFQPAEVLGRDNQWRPQSEYLED